MSSPYAWNNWICKLYLEGKVQLHPLFPDPNNGAAVVPESETSLAGSGEWPGLKMKDKKGGKNVPYCSKKP